MKRPSVRLLLALGLGIGCGNPNRLMDDTLRKRASFDLSCPAEQLQLTPFDNVTSGVDGCSHRATYIWIPEERRWVMNEQGVTNQLQAQPGGPPSAPPAPAQR